MKLRLTHLCFFILVCIIFSLAVTAKREDPRHTYGVQRENSEMNTTKRPFSNICIWKICIKTSHFGKNKSIDKKGQENTKTKLKYKSQMNEAIMRKTWGI